MRPGVDAGARAYDRRESFMQQHVDAACRAIDDANRRQKQLATTCAYPIYRAVCNDAPSEDALVNMALTHTRQAFCNRKGMTSHEVASLQTLIVLAWVGCFKKATARASLAVRACATVHDFWSQLWYAERGREVRKYPKHSLPNVTHDDVLQVPRIIDTGRICVTRLDRFPTSSIELEDELVQRAARDGHIRMRFDWDPFDAASPLLCALVHIDGWETTLATCSYCTSTEAHVASYKELHPLAVVHYTLKR